MKSTFKLLSVLLSISVLCVSCATTQTHDSSTIESKTQFLKEKKPKNIILLIGDGMGLSEVSASLYYQDKPSNFERFTTIGLIKTSASSDLITDSAAGATAFASGVKTYNGAIGVDKDTTAVETIKRILLPGLYQHLLSFTLLRPVFTHTPSRGECMRKLQLSYRIPELIL